MHVSILFTLFLCLLHTIKSRKWYDFSGQKGHRGFVENPREDADLITDFYNPVVEEFKVATISPRIIPKSPMKNCMVTWDHVAISKLGNFVHKKRILHQPVVYFYGWEGTLYTLVMFHPDVPSNDTAYKNWYPWVVGNIPGLCSIHKGDILWPYRMSAEPLKSGIQRHIFVIYKQTGRIEFDDEDTAKLSRLPPRFNVTQFAEKYELGDPDFGNFLYSED